MSTRLRSECRVAGCETTAQRGEQFPEISGQRGMKIEWLRRDGMQKSYPLGMKHDARRRGQPGILLPAVGMIAEQRVAD
jgi:hypothetical protein